MNMQDCPCNGCTPETGRGPGCHNEACPHGWYEWDQKHQREREAYKEYKRQDQRADGVLISAQEKGRPTRRKYQ